MWKWCEVFNIKFTRRLHIPIKSNQPMYVYIIINIQSRSLKKSICWYGTQRLLIWKTETAIFLATKYEKTIMPYSYLFFYKYFLHFELLASNTIKNKSIHLNSWHHNHKKQKNSLETQIVLLIFSVELEISGVAVQRIHESSKKW